MTNLDIYYAQGINEETAKGRFVSDPEWANFQVRYPYSLYLTLRNKDLIKTELEKPIKVDYW